MLAPAGPGLLRQMLMVVVIGLIVARPLVYGGDPGLQDPQNDPGGLVLTVFWFVAAAVWGLWRVWSRQDDLYAGLVEAGLGVVVILVFGMAYGVAAYQHPARLIAWEWLAMLVALFLVRQLTVSVEEQHGLLAALLASAVTLSAFGLYQAWETLPRQRAETPTIEAMLNNPKFAKAGILATSKDDPHVITHFRRLQQPNIFGTFAHPNSFADYLVLLLPALAGAAFLAIRGPYPAWQKFLAALFALSAAVALWYTHSRGGLLAIGLVGIVVGVLVFRRVLLRHKVAAIVVLLVLVGAAVGIYEGGFVNTLLGKPQATAAARADYWTATWHMIQERPWFGFGAGSFQSTYTRFMSETAGEEITDPHNFVLEMWTTGGVFAVLALLTALAAFFVQVVRGARATPVEAQPPPPPAPAGPDDLPPIRWTFYLGGVFGLLLAYVLQASYLSSRDEITGAAVIAGVQSILWFASFALFEQIRWTRHARALVLTAGVAALLLNLLVSGGIGFPQVATLLWVVVALALNSFGSTSLPWLSGKPIIRYAMLPVLIAGAVIYFVGVMVPVTGAMQAMRSLNAGTGKVTALEEAAKTGDPDNAALNSQLALVYGSQHSEALASLERAKTLDPHGSEAYRAEYNLRKQWAMNFAGLEVNQQRAPLANVRWTVIPFATGPASQLIKIYELGVWRPFGLFRIQPNLSDTAVGLAVGPACRALLDNPATWRPYPWDRMQGASSVSNFAQYKQQYLLAAKPLLDYLPNNPNNTKLHHDIADALYRAEEQREVADAHARLALELDAIARSVLGKEKDEYAPIIARKLTDRQRTYLRERLGIPPD